jgi:hypothetical protein
MLDFDVGWGHRLLGFSDHVNLVSGLVYGIVIIVTCAMLLFAILMSTAESETGSSLPHTSRWFVFFLNLQVLFYILLVMCKLPRLCYIKDHYYPSLDLDCGFLRYLLLEHAVFIISFASFCIWIFSSYAYVLTFGDSSGADKPNFSQQLETMLNMEDIHAMERRMGVESYLQPHQQQFLTRVAATEGFLNQGREGAYGPSGNAMLPISQASTAPGLAAPSRHSIPAAPAAGLGSAYNPSAPARPPYMV